MDGAAVECGEFDDAFADVVHGVDEVAAAAVDDALVAEVDEGEVDDPVLAGARSLLSLTRLADTGQVADAAAAAGRSQ